MRSVASEREAVETKESRRQLWAPLASLPSQSGSDVYSAGLGRLSPVPLLDRALALPQHNFAYTLASRHTRSFGGLSTFWDLSGYFKTSDWQRTATGIPTADYTRPVYTTGV